MPRVDMSKAVTDRTFSGHLILNTLTAHCGTRDPIKVFDLKREDGSLVADIKLVINGVETDLMSFVKELERQFDRIVDERAKALLQERASKFNDFIDRLQRMAANEFPDIWERSE